jgi:hypothetical protein
MKNILSLVSILFIFSCATSKEIVLPSGEKGYTVNCGTYEGNTWSACYEKAGEICPTGYDILEKIESNDKQLVATGNLLQTLDDDKRSLVISCKK